MAGVQIRKQGSQDETRRFGHGEAEIFRMGGEASVGRFTLQPGWKWSNDVKPIAGTKSCEVEHFGYCLSGRMRIVTDDGESADIGPGDVMHIHPGHDAWVLGDEPCVLLDFAGAANYVVQGLGDLARRESGASEHLEARH